jgi:hypothetical protein
LVLLFGRQVACFLLTTTVVVAEQPLKLLATAGGGVKVT